MVGGAFVCEGGASGRVRGVWVLLLLMLAAAQATRGLEGVKNETVWDDGSQEKLIQEEAEEAEEGRILGWDSLALMFLLCTSFCVGNWLHSRHITLLSESGAIILLGLGVGAFVSYGIPHLKDYMSFNHHFFNFVLLPPIIFESGYSVKKILFFRNLASILVFAIIGTIISTTVMGLGIYYAGLLDIVSEQSKLTILESLAFAALISAVDPVATLATFRSLSADPNLDILVYGESVLNDAVSIVLYKTVIHIWESNVGFDSHVAVVAVGKFTYIFLGSFGIGVGCALLTALIFKHCRLDETGDSEIPESLILWFWSYVAFILAENLELSGIVASLFAGIAMAHYARFNMSTLAQTYVSKVLKMLATTAEALVFLLIGVSFFMYHVDGEYQWRFSLIVIVLCFVSRALNIFPLSFLVNRFRRSPIPINHQIMMWFAGLRGAIAVALATHFPVAKSHYLVVSTTIVVTLFTVFFMGGLTTAMLKLLGIETGVSEKRQTYPLHSHGRNILKAMILDKKFLKPLFRRNVTEDSLLGSSGVSTPGLNVSGDIELTRSRGVSDAVKQGMDSIFKRKDSERSIQAPIISRGPSSPTLPATPLSPRRYLLGTYREEENETDTEEEEAGVRRRPVSGGAELRRGLSQGAIHHRRFSLPRSGSLGPRGFEQPIEAFELGMSALAARGSVDNEIEEITETMSDTELDAEVY